jgi:hypothetical protein
MITSGTVDLRIHGQYGEMMYRDAVYLQRLESSCEYLLLVNAAMMNKVLGTQGDISKLYLSVHTYRTTDAAIFYKARRPTSIDTLNALYREISMTGSAVTRTVFINGQQARPTSASDLRIYDYVEIIDDPNISEVVTIPLLLTNPNAIYSSPSLDGDDRVIVHIPKASNENQYLITHNMCDVYVYSKSENASARTGYYVHQCYGVGTFVQLTHQDFAISKAVFDTYSSLLAANSDLEMTVKIRINPLELRNYLIRDNSYINLLYTIPDETILAFLSGNGPANIPCWEGASLEDATYGKMMFDAPLTDAEFDMEKCITTLGYHTVATLTHPHVFEAQVTSIAANGSALVSWDAPYLFQTYQALMCVYLNGIKIPGYSLSTPALHIGVQLPSSTGVKVGDRVMMEAFEFSSAGVVGHTAVTVTEPVTVSVPYRTFRVYKKIQDVASIPVIFYTEDAVFGCSYEVSDNYDVTETSAGYDIAFDETAVGSVFVIVDMSGATRLGSYTFTPDITVTDGPLFRGPYKLDVHGVTDRGTYLVFLNGRRLVENVDFINHKLYDPDYPGLYHFVGSELIITNMSYLVETENTIEVFYVNDMDMTKFSGFVLNEYLAKGVQVPAWYTGATTLSIRGEMQYEVVGDDYDVETGLIRFNRVEDTNGSLYHSNTMISSTISQFLDAYVPDDDDTRLMDIYAYLKTLWPEDLGYVVLTQSYSIYSCYMSRILEDLVDGRTTVSYQIGGFAPQLSEYDWIKVHDPVYSNTLDLRYIDIYPTWHRYEVPRTLYRLLKDVTEELLPQDTIASGDTADV